MCGRFFVEGENENELLSRMIEEAERRQQALTGESTIAVGEVFPGSTVAAMAMGKSGEIGMFPMQWGFHRSDKRGLIINTRSETALEKPLFRKSMLERRCLIPCSWYFEWETRDAQQSLLESFPSFQMQPDGQIPRGKTKNQMKIKYAIRPKSPGIIYLAGIYRYEEAQRLPVLSILQGKGTVYRDNSDRNIMYNKKSTGNYKAMRKGDFIIHLRTFEGGLEYATLDGISSPAYKILRTDKLIPEAYKAYFRSKQFIEGRLAIAVTGVRDGKNIEMSAFWQILVPVPCLEEQQKIADFLGTYDEAISCTKQELDKWKELKKGLLQQMFA